MLFLENAQAHGQTEPAGQTHSRTIAIQREALDPVERAELGKVEQELSAERQELAAEKGAQDTIRDGVEILAGVLIVVSVLAFGLQIWSLVADVRIRRRNEVDGTIQNEREAQLHERFLKVLDIASAAAKDAQIKVAGLEEGGIRRAGETLQLINNLLTITERAAAKAAGAQFDFLSKTIGSIDSDCRKLIIAATKDEDRDIIAKPNFSEEVRILTVHIDALDNQITSYNESVPAQFGDSSESDAETSGRLRWSRLSLTGPCLFVRGQNHLQRQNFSAAISDWKLALTAAGADSIRVDANYWIGYVNNTLGNFEESPHFLKEAARVAPDQRKPELVRLELETRFFALDLDAVPFDLISEGEKYFDTLQAHRVSKRIIANFATTLGNIALVRSLRSAVASASENTVSADALGWFERAISIAPRSRWARFGMYQDLLLAGKVLPDTAQSEIRDVIGSVNREYQARVEARSKVLSKMTEYMCLIMLGDVRTDDESARLTGVAHAVEAHSSEVTARTIYSQFRKQNVQKDVFLAEFNHLQRSKNLVETMRASNSKLM
jgi:tetratricopeptide (TPR) repeat protein